MGFEIFPPRLGSGGFQLTFGGGSVASLPLMDRSASMKNSFNGAFCTPLFAIRCLVVIKTRAAALKGHILWPAFREHARR